MEAAVLYRPQARAIFEPCQPGLPFCAGRLRKTYKAIAVAMQMKSKANASANPATPKLPSKSTGLQRICMATADTIPGPTDMVTVIGLASPPMIPSASVGVAKLDEHHFDSEQSVKVHEFGL
jgi:hypothetical protein